MPASLDGLITYLAKGLVDRPDQVELRSKEAEGAKVFELKVAPEDVGKVIGRDGRTIHAIRTLLSAAALKNGEKARLDLLEDRRSGQAQAPEPNPQ